MSTSAPAAPERLRLDTKFFFGIGSAAESIALYSVSAFAMFYYNQVLGLPAELAGLAISASLVLDGISDPLVGSLSDRTRSRLGRRHPYMLAAPIPIGLSLIAIFNPPAEMSQWALFAWFALSVTLMRQFMTFFNTPHLALGGELSSDYLERSKVMSWNNFFTWAGAAGTAFFALSYVFKATPEYPRGLLNPEPYGPFAWGLAAVAITILFASAWFTRDQIPRLPKPAANLPKFSPLEFFNDVAKVMRNFNYLWLLIAFFFLSMMIGMRAGLNLYMGTFYWQLTSEELRWFILGSASGYIGGFIFAARLHRRFDKRMTMIIWAVVYSIAPALPNILGQLGVIDAQTPNLLGILVAFSVVSYAAASVLNITVMSALADIADENELKFGLRQEGVLYATRSLAAKVDQAIGAMVAGLVLLWIAFPAKAVPGEVPAGVIGNLALWDGVLAAIPGLIAAAFYAKYGITRAKYEETKAQIAAKRAAAGEAVTPPPPLVVQIEGVVDIDAAPGPGPAKA
ncbi:MAG: MFS transporter [Caulobacter sp.]|nr:MFS transporter [Caulobacter sp.]